MYRANGFISELNKTLNIHAIVYSHDLIIMHKLSRHKDNYYV